MMYDRVADQYKVTPSPQLIDINNIAEWFYKDNEKEFYEYSDFGCCKMPFDDVWLEHRPPSVCNNQGKIKVYERKESKSESAHIKTMDVSDGEYITHGSHPGLGLLDGQFPHLVEDKPLSRKPKDAVVALLFTEGNDGILRNLGGAFYFLCEEGRIIDNITMSGDPRYVMFMSPTIYPFLIAGTFMNCRNVELRAGKAQKRRKKGKKPQHSFYTLLIDPLRRKARSAGGSGSEIDNALHICRGHFKTYDEKPLFGRIKGTYYWGAHTRGKAENGVVEKVYAV